MLKIAIIQFPGLNTEYETRREINRAGMSGEFFRWNDDPKKLEKYDGYVIGGGFSYEDRGRAGIIASLDPVMKKIKTQAEKGKPVLGICNGAQILLECGLIPGVDGNKLAMALARNKRIREGEVLGTGYYNAWVNLKLANTHGGCMFTSNFKENEIIKAPVAHGEGRFTTEFKDLVEKLNNNGQIVFRYCDRGGVISDQFPINPNGAMFNIAAICNPAGNVMAIMPHLERDAISSEKLFSSMRDAITNAKTGAPKKRAKHLIVPSLKLFPLLQFQKQPKSLQMFVSLIITDNEAETYETTLKQLGWPTISVKRTTHLELSYSGRFDLQKTTRKLIQSGVLLNTNKEFAVVEFPKEKLFFDAKREKFTPVPKINNDEKVLTTTLKFIVRERQDFVGLSKLTTLQKRLKFNEITDVKVGTLWEITFQTKSKNVAMEELRKLIATHIFFNPHSQEAKLLS